VAKTKKHVGDVIGISRSTVRKPVKSAPGRRAKGIEVAPPRSMKRAGVVGGVRGRGR
jgi:hypothetical protein